LCRITTKITMDISQTIKSTEVKLKMTHSLTQEEQPVIQDRMLKQN